MWREIIGLEGHYEISSIGEVRSVDRKVANSRGNGTRTVRGKPVKKHNNGLGAYLHKNGSARSVSISTLLRENFPELTPFVESLLGESWLPIPGWDGYEASSIGRLKRLERETTNGHGSVTLQELLLHPTVNADGYLTVNLNDGAAIKSLMVHRLVAWTFIGPGGEEDEINHKDFDRKNNKFGNLEWIFHIDNVKYSQEAGRYAGNGKVAK